jgi:hypothetical protein
MWQPCLIYSLVYSVVAELSLDTFSVQSDSVGVLAFILLQGSYATLISLNISEFLN